MPKHLLENKKMPITISYNDFITPTGSMSTGIDTPGSFSPIASNITNLDASDMKIVFTDLPSGLKVAATQDTPLPFDSVFVDIESYNDYVLMSGSGNNNWANTDDAAFQARYVASAGFWALGATGGFSPGCILTGIGSGTSNILDVAFEGINFQETTYTKADADIESIFLERGRKYILDGSAEQFIDPVFFYQTSNYSWFPIEVVANGTPLDGITISGTSYSGSGSIVNLVIPFSGIVYWSGNALQHTESYNLQSFAPQPFTSLNEGYSWNATYANENFSSYSVLANNSGNTGTAVIELTNAENFNSLIPPLRKLYVTFTDNP